ncbi:hypothetical protein [Nocardia sp. CA-290969]|uniref:hypothetical protein n=1 Tax=Nocardia sp. CA-290969 TaxID=3239986 RepID=UPI003D9185AC
MTGTAIRTPYPAPESGVIYAVHPPAVIQGSEVTPYVYVTSCPQVGDTQVLPCTRDGHVLRLVLLGLVSTQDHAAALLDAGWELEEVTSCVVA